MRFLFLSLLVFAASAQADQRTNLTVVELFTSQGCSSCPPADALLGRMVARKDVLPLSFHVDYWNYLGWEDALSTKFATARQVAYRDAMGGSYVYTPQFVVDGARQYGLRQAADLIRALDAPPKPGLALSWTPEGLTLAPLEGGLAEGTIWALTFEKVVESEISAGENRGRTLQYYHSVTELTPVGLWTNKEQFLPLSAPPNYGRAILVADDQGRIFAAAAWTSDDA